VREAILVLLHTFGANLFMMLRPLALMPVLRIAADPPPRGPATALDSIALRTR
jgi:hypothetical protein